MKRHLLFLIAAAMLAPSVVLASEQTLPNGIARIGASTTGADYSSVNVAIVDTGIDLDNPELNVVGGVDCTEPQQSLFGNAFGNTAFRVEAYASKDLGRVLPGTADGYEDGYGHGTHVAGIVGARDNGIGVVGVAPNASLWSVRVLDSSGGGTLESITCGLNWIHENRDLIDVVNMSLGGDVGIDVMNAILPCGMSSVPFTYPDPKYGPGKVLLDDQMHAAICRLHDDGIPVVVAAGNGDALSEQTIPAAYDEVITVSSFVDTDGKPGGLGGRVNTDECPFGGADDMFFTHHNFTPEQRYGSYSGKSVDISAPGVCVLSTLPQGFYARLTGTSMATPHVAGVIARMYGDYPEYRLLGVEAIRGVLLDNAEQTDPASFRDKDAYSDPIVHVIEK